jgi:hypothetical protein
MTSRVFRDTIAAESTNKGGGFKRLQPQNSIWEWPDEPKDYKSESTTTDELYADYNSRIDKCIDEVQGADQLQNRQRPMKFVLTTTPESTTTEEIRADYNSRIDDD